MAELRFAVLREAIHACRRLRQVVRRLAQARERVLHFRTRVLRDAAQRLRRRVDLGHGASQLIDQLRDVLRRLRQAGSRGAQALHSLRQAIQILVREHATDTQEQIVGTAHQLRQVRQEHVEVGRDRRDHRISRSLRQRHRLVDAGHFFEIDEQQAGDALQSQAGARRCTDRRLAVDLGDRNDAAGIALVDRQAPHAADVDAEIAHRAAAIQSAHAAGEVDLVQLVVAGVVRVRVPEHEGDGHGQDQQDEGTDGDIVGFALHGGYSPLPDVFWGRALASAARARGPWKYS